MSLAVTGVWTAGVWNQRVWGDNVWHEPASGATDGWGFWGDYQRHQDQSEERKRLRRERQEEAKRIALAIDRDLALKFRQIEKREERQEELEELTNLVSKHADEVARDTSARIMDAVDKAIELKTFSRMEMMERLLNQYKEEEEFLLLATEILVNQ